MCFFWEGGISNHGSLEEDRLMAPFKVEVITFFFFFFAQTHHSLALALTTEEVADVSVDWVQIKRPLRGASSCVSGRLPVSV